MKIHPKFIWLVGILLTVNLLLRNHQVSLWEEDEAAYMGFALQMLETGDWLEPSYQWSTIHRKTPLHIWTIACSFKCFGYNEFALRLPSVMAVLLCILVLYRCSIPIWGPTVAQKAAIILACSIQIPLMGKIAFTDATLLLFETIALLSLLNFLHRPHWKWNMALWISIAAGIMTKGPPIVLIVGGLWVLLAIFHPLRKNLIRTHPWIWAWFAAAPFAAWCYLSYQQDYLNWQLNGGNETFDSWWQTELYGKKTHLLPFLWDWYVIKRINGHVLGQSGFVGYHLLVLTIAFFSWLPFWCTSLWSTFRNILRPKKDQLSLVLWLIMAWFFWELMSSKLPSYSMAAQPALALIMALHINALEDKQTPKSIDLLTGIYAFLLSIIALILPWFAYRLFGTESLYSILLMSFVLLLMAVKLFIQRRQIPPLFQNLALSGLLLMLCTWLCISPWVENSDAKVYDDIIEKAWQIADQQSETLLVFGGVDNKQKKISLWVYAQLKFNQVEYRDFYNSLKVVLDDKPAIMIIGTDYIDKMKEAYRARKLVFDPIEVQHRSTDDNLKKHNYWIFKNAQPIEKTQQ